MNDLISRQAAIDALDEVSKHYTEKGREWHPHVDLMIYAIKELPSAQPDLQEYSVWFRIGETLVDVSKMHITAEEGIEKIRSYLVRMKKPERKVATWKRIDYKPCGHDYECSSCGWKNDMRTHYCPSCGATMVEGEEG